MSRPTIVRLVMACGFLFLAGPAWAQTAASGAIAGEVKDTTGAVLPGVTVEAASPALIEKVRTVVTDGQGQYKIVELRPGTYTVTFSLTGFSTVKREGFDLTAGFTATVNADMKVGSLEETLTVSGTIQVVDTHDVRSQNLLSRQNVDSLPTFRTIAGFSSLTVGNTSSVYFNTTYTNRSLLIVEPHRLLASPRRRRERGSLRVGSGRFVRLNGGWQW